MQERAFTFDKRPGANVEEAGGDMKELFRGQADRTLLSHSSVEQVGKSTRDKRSSERGRSTWQRQGMAGPGIASRPPVGPGQCLDQASPLHALPVRTRDGDLARCSPSSAMLISTWRSVIRESLSAMVSWRPLKHPGRQRLDRRWIA